MSILHQVSPYVPAAACPLLRSALADVEMWFDRANAHHVVTVAVPMAFPKSKEALSAGRSPSSSDECQHKLWKGTVRVISLFERSFRSSIGCWKGSDKAHKEEDG